MVHFLGHDSSDSGPPSWSAWRAWLGQLPRMSPEGARCNDPVAGSRPAKNIHKLSEPNSRALDSNQRKSTCKVRVVDLR
ncbi:hypothetical protein E2C01_002029 [Portunus trituberculatus]|uniref:Uncharacterized protein n=1 Tax=Portunus trituberculatus TaxID=210409 RepID=A0A5B7CIN6_PORTR|nr:hypothetical protein [Portunus trituberculatus]